MYFCSHKAKIMSNKPRKYRSLSKRLLLRIVLVVLTVLFLMAWGMREINRTATEHLAGDHFHVLLDVTNTLIENDLHNMNKALATDSADEAKKRSIKWLRKWLKKQDFNINRRGLISTKKEWDYKELNMVKDQWVYSIVIDREGNYISHPDSMRMLHDNLFRQLSENNDSLSLHIINDMKNGIGGESITNIDHIKVRIYYDPLNHTDWTMAIIVPQNIENILILTWSIFQGMLILIALLCIYLVCHFTIRHTTRPLRALAQSAEEVAKGHFDTHLPEIRHHDEIGLLRDSFENMQQSLGTYIEQLRTTTAEKASMERDLHIAHRIQMALLPTTFPQRDDVDIYATLTPAKAVGGDLYDFFVRDDKLFFCIGDVTGKGVPAALLMTVSKSLFRAYSATEDTAEQIVTQMNQIMSENNQVGLFVTMFVGVLDLSSGILNYCSAGHVPPLLIGERADFLSFVPALPIGCLDDTTYQANECVLAPGTTLFLYTDGLNEAKDAANSNFGKTRIMEVARQSMDNAHLAPKALIEQMAQARGAFVGAMEQSDDLTMLAVMRL